MDGWKRDLLGRIVDEIDRYSEGQLSLRSLVENARGLFDAADISDQPVREAFELVWAPLVVNLTSGQPSGRIRRGGPRRTLKRPSEISGIGRIRSRTDPSPRGDPRTSRNLSCLDRFGVWRSPLELLLPDARLLRPLVDADLDAIHEQMKCPESVRMAAFTARTRPTVGLPRPHARVRDDPSCVQRVIEADGTIAGTVGSFIIDNQTEVTYWIDRALSGRGIASAALQSFLSRTTERPLFARAATDTAASLRVFRARSDASASIAASHAVAERRSGDVLRLD